MAATAAHPFYVHNQGWTEAEHLRVGDQLRTDIGDTSTVVSVAATGETATVHNFTVHDLHNYHVATNNGTWILVHNATGAGGCGMDVHAPAGTRPAAGQDIYRVYGGDSAASGASWSPVDPGTVPNYRRAAGLPSGGASGATNTGQFVIEGTLNDPAAVVLQREALSLDGMEGGLPEYIIPQWMDNGSITIRRVSGANPEF